MSPPAARLLACVLLFASWLGYLAYQVFVTRPLTAAGTPLVLSRPQLLTSEVDVIADIPDAVGPAIVTEVLRGEGVAVGDRVELPNLEACRPLGRTGGRAASPPDWSGPGSYLVPLRRGGRGKFEVAPIPASPGHDYPGPPRIYPATAESRAQYAQARADRE